MKTYVVNQALNAFLNKTSEANEINVIKSNPQSPKCWNEYYCEVSIEDDSGGHLVLKVSLYEESEPSETEFKGKVIETWYWDKDNNPMPIAGVFLNPYNDVLITFHDYWNGILKKE